MKQLFLYLSMACAAAQAGSLTYVSLVDPANVAFCADPSHPVCVEYTQIALTGFTDEPTAINVVDENGFATVYSFSNLIVNVDPSGDTYSGSVTPDEPFSITLAQNNDLLRGLFELVVMTVPPAEGDLGVSPPPVFIEDPSVTTPEPSAAALFFTGLAAAGIIRFSQERKLS
jgi:hypothetical protein